MQERSAPSSRQVFNCNALLQCCLQHFTIFQIFTAGILLKLFCNKIEENNVIIYQFSRHKSRQNFRLEFCYLNQSYPGFYILAGPEEGRILLLLTHFSNQVIQTETSQGSCPIRFEQPTKFPGPSSFVSCSRFGSLIFSVCRYIN